MARKKPPSYDLVELRSQLYIDLPQDIGPMRQLLEQYSQIPPAEVEKHILAVREKLWSIKPYGCIGKFRFLQLDFVTDPRYQDALARLRRRSACSREALLDLGCCVGQLLRQLAFEGVDSGRLYGADLDPRFLSMGYEMFRDRDSLRALFVAGDVLSEDAKDDPLRLLDGKMTMVHASSFFHLFSWDDQVVAARRIVRFLRPGDKSVFIFGRQVGCDDPGRQTGPRGQARFLHNARSWQMLWDEVGRLTGTRWRTEVEIIPGSNSEVTKIEDQNGNTEGLHRLRFGVFRA